MAEFASNAKANTGVTLGAIGTGLGVLSGGLNNILGGWGNNCGCSENMAVSRYELAQESKISKLESELALRDANIYNEQKILELYKYIDGKLEGINATLATQAVYNATQTATMNCMGGQINELFNLTKRIVPITNVCPQPMPQYNSWTAPTTTTTTTP